MPRLTPHIKKYIIPTIVLLIPIAARAEIPILENLKNAGDRSGLGTNPLPVTIGLIINLVLGLLGMIFLVLIVYAGFTWLLARGREEEIQKAQKIIETSVIGLLVILIAYAISKFVFEVLVSSAGIVK